jgi:thiol-disulfide isomerase/thioredoxin
MKIKYLLTLSFISILGLGTLASCSSPDSANTKPESAELQSKANPCAAKTNPCASKANPCASKANPCASKANPCAAKANPCAAKANPCAAKTKSVGGPLAQELQGKPVVIDVFATWCAGCKNIEPTLGKLKKDYGDRANFVVLDVTDKKTLEEAKAKAEKLGLSKFLEANQSQTSTVAIVDPATGNVLAMFKNNAEAGDYTKVLDAALTKS